MHRGKKLVPMRARFLDFTAVCLKMLNRFLQIFYIILPSETLALHLDHAIIYRIQSVLLRDRFGYC